MKKMPAICAGLALVLGFSLFAAGCAEHGEMKTMESGMETMHKDPMGSMDPGMGKMEKPGMEMEMPMEEGYVNNRQNEDAPASGRSA